MHHSTDMITHTNTFVTTPVVEHWFLSWTGKQRGEVSKGGTDCTGGYKGVRAVRPKISSRRMVQLAARVLLHASSHRQDNTYHSLCYTSRGALIPGRDPKKRGGEGVMGRGPLALAGTSSPTGIGSRRMVQLAARVLLHAPSHRQDNTYQRRY